MSNKSIKVQGRVDNGTRSGEPTRAQVELHLRNDDKTTTSLASAVISIRNKKWTARFDDLDRNAWHIAFVTIYKGVDMTLSNIVYRKMLAIKTAR